MQTESGPTTVASRPNYGALSSESEVLADLTRRLVGDLNPAMVWLFESRARQDGRPDNDFETYDVSMRLRTSFVYRIVDEGRLLYEAAR